MAAIGAVNRINGELFANAGAVVFAFGDFIKDNRARRQRSIDQDAQIESPGDAQTSAIGSL